MRSGKRLFDHSARTLRRVVRRTAVLVCLVASIPSLAAREKEAIQYGAGLIVNVPFSESEVSQVVQDVAQNGIIRGSKEYSKDEYISGAEAATSTRVFPAWTEGGKVFYKVRFNALDPQNFKNSGDVGTLAVRYVVQSQDEKHTVLRLDARFVEDFRHAAHASNGSVENAEYKDIHDRLESLALMKAEARSGKRTPEFSSSISTSMTAGAILRDVPSEQSTASSLPSAENIAKPATPVPTPEPASEVSLEQRVHDLRQQVERIVKAPGAALKTAPFHTASTLQSLPRGAEVLIVISTPYWYGVETHDGKHGWVLRDQLELLP